MPRFAATDAAGRTLLSLSYAAASGEAVPLIAKGSALPATNEVVVTTSGASQSVIKIVVCVGARAAAAHCALLGNLTVRVTPRPRGLAQVRLRARVSRVCSLSAFVASRSCAPHARGGIALARVRAVRCTTLAYVQQVTKARRSLGERCCEMVGGGAGGEGEEEEEAKGRTGTALSGDPHLNGRQRSPPSVLLHHNFPLHARMPADACPWAHAHLACPRAHAHHHRLDECST